MDRLELAEAPFVGSVFPCDVFAERLGHVRLKVRVNLLNPFRGLSINQVADILCEKIETGFNFGIFVRLLNLSKV